MVQDCSSSMSRDLAALDIEYGVVPGSSDLTIEIARVREDRLHSQGRPNQSRFEKLISFALMQKDTPDVSMSSKRV